MPNRDYALDVEVDFTPPEQLQPPGDVPVEIATMGRDVTIGTPAPVEITTRQIGPVDIHSEPGVDVDTRPGDDLVVR